MTTPRYLQQARDSLAAAAEAAQRAEVRAKLAGRGGLAYAAANHEQTVYLVTQNGKVIGELHHPTNNGAVTDWQALPDGDPARALGPFRTARQAAAALLSSWPLETAAEDLGGAPVGFANPRRVDS